VRANSAATQRRRSTPQFYCPKVPSGALSSGHVARHSICQADQVVQTLASGLSCCLSWQIRLKHATDTRDSHSPAGLAFSVLIAARRSPFASYLAVIFACRTILCICVSSGVSECRRSCGLFRGSFAGMMFLLWLIHSATRRPQEWM